MTEPEAQRFGACDARQLVDVRLTREGVGGRGERAIRALGVQGVGRLVAQAAVGHRVRESKAVRPGVDVRKSHAVTEPAASRPARTSITAIGRR